MLKNGVRNTRAKARRTMKIVRKGNQTYRNISEHLIFGCKDQLVSLPLPCWPGNKTVEFCCYKGRFITNYIFCERASLQMG